MALRATKTTYGITHVGNGIEIRRRVIAGQEVPPGIEVSEGDLEEFTRQPRGYNPEQVTRRTDGERRPEGDEADAVNEANKARSRSQREATRKH